MKVLDDNQLENVVGGSVWTGIAVAAIVIFISGLLEGQIKLKWQKLKNIVFIGNLNEKPFIQIRLEGAIMFTKL